MPIGDENHRQQRQCNHAAEKTRRHHASDRVDRHHFHCAQLIGRPHQADFGSERRAGAACEQESRDDRTEFLDQGERGCGAQRVFRTEPLQQVIALQTKNPAHEQAASHDDDQRQRAGVVDLFDNQPGACEDAGSLPDDAHEK